MKLVLISFVCCLVSSIITALIMHLRSAHGVLRIDHSDPDKDVYRIEINNLNDLSVKKQVILTVDNSAILSQK